jgi:hypothetical protein
VISGAAVFASDAERWMREPVTTTVSTFELSDACAYAASVAAAEAIAAVHTNVETINRPRIDLIFIATPPKSSR